MAHVRSPHFPARRMGEVARDVAARLLRLHAECGGGDTLEAATWLPVAERLGCRVVAFYAPHGPAGEYLPSREFAGVGVIAYNTARSPRRQSAVLAHELAHHVLYPHAQGSLFAVDVAECYDDEPGSVRHRTARMVERRIVGRRRIKD